MSSSHASWNSYIVFKPLPFLCPLIYFSVKTLVFSFLPFQSYVCFRPSWKPYIVFKLCQFLLFPEPIRVSSKSSWKPSDVRKPYLPFTLAHPTYMAPSNTSWKHYFFHALTFQNLHVSPRNTLGNPLMSANLTFPLPLLNPHALFQHLETLLL